MYGCCACLHVYVGACMWMPKVALRCLSQSPLYLFGHVGTSIH